MKIITVFLLNTVAFILPVSAATTEQTFQDTALAVMKNIVISTGASGDKAEQIASGFLQDLTGGKGIQLTEKEKVEISKDDFAVANYAAVLKSYAELEKQGGKRMAVFHDYAKKPNLPEIEKLIMTKLVKPLTGRLDKMRVMVAINQAKMTWLKYITYEQKHGKAPASIDELKLEVREQFVDPKTGKVMNWKILPVDQQFGTPERKAVIMAPVAIAGKRVVALLDGGAIAVDEEIVPAKLR